MSDLDMIRNLLEKLEIVYTTSKSLDTGVTSISIRQSPKIVFTFFKDGNSASIYTDW